MDTARAYVASGNATGEILVVEFDRETGELRPAGRAHCGAPASFAALHPTGRALYATQNRTERIAAFGIDSAGTLSPFGQVAIEGRPDASAVGPAYLSVDATGRFLLTANYRGHNTVTFALGDRGEIGAVVQSLSAGTHAHAIVLDATNRFAFVPYLGSDLVAQYRFDPRSGLLSPNEPAHVALPAGTGPRHLAFHPDAPWVYLLGETSSTVHLMAFDPMWGRLTLHESTPLLPADWAGKRWSADLHVHPSGRFLYASNRAHDSIAIFALDPRTGLPAPKGHVSTVGSTPRSFSIDPTGRWMLVANQESAELRLFEIDPDSGELCARNRLPVADAPYFVKFAAASSSA